MKHINPTFTLETLMNNINTLLVNDKIKQLVIKAIHNAIYVADWATNYQSVTLGMRHWAPEKIYPKICVLHDVALDVTTSVDHEFFTCSRIVNVWEYSYTLINKIIGHGIKSSTSSVLPPSPARLSRTAARAAKCCWHTPPPPPQGPAADLPVISPAHAVI